MLTSLFPHTHTRYSSLPVLGGVLEDLCVWLEARGYPPSAIGRRMEAAPFLDECLRQRQIQSVSGCTAAQLRACLPRQKRWTPQIAYTLGPVTGGETALSSGAQRARDGRSACLVQ